MLPHRLAELIRGELRDGSAVEDLALDGASLDDGALVVAEAVEPGGEQGVDGRRNGDLRQVAGWNPVAVLGVSRPSSMSMASISSTKSGLPSAAS